MTSKAQPTVQEITAAIKKSSAINIIIEGKDDIIAYRSIEDHLAEETGEMILLISAGGRDNLLQIFESLRDESALDSCYFICDLDLWVFDNIPAEFRSDRIVTTNGYSIENDIFRDYDIGNLLTTAEALILNNDLVYYQRWFAASVYKKLAGVDCSTSDHPNAIIDVKKDEAEVDSLLSINADAKKIFDLISNDHKKYLRGKSYLALHSKQLNAPRRRPKHSDLSLFEHAVAAKGPMLASLYEEVRTRMIRVGEVQII